MTLVFATIYPALNDSVDFFFFPILSEGTIDSRWTPIVISFFFPPSFLTFYVCAICLSKESTETVVSDFAPPSQGCGLHVYFQILPESPSTISCQMKSRGFKERLSLFPFLLQSSPILTTTPLIFVLDLLDALRTSSPSFTHSPETMTTFSSLVSQFAHNNNGEGSSSSNSQEKKRTRSSIPRSASNLSSQDSDTLEESTSELSTQVRKSMRLSTTHSRVISADSVKTKPHHRRPTPHPSSSRVTVKDEDYQDEEVIGVKDEEADAAFQPKSRVKKHSFVNGYTPPEVYAHLPLLPDIIDYDLDVLWVGINPGIKSSEKSHHFSGPTNHFWPCLNDSGKF